VDTSIVINQWSSDGPGRVTGSWRRIAQFPGDRDTFEACLPIPGEVPQVQAGDRVEVVMVETKTGDRIYAREMVVPAGTPGQLAELRKEYVEGL
jgi:hypothetical protein